MGVILMTDESLKNIEKKFNKILDGWVDDKESILRTEEDEDFRILEEIERERELAKEKDKEGRAKNYKEYMHLVKKTIDETCNNNVDKINSIFDYEDFFQHFRVPQDLQNLRWVSLVDMVEMISSFLGTTTIGDYNSSYIHLRQLFETFLRAMYFDCEGKKVNSIIGWLRKNERDSISMKTVIDGLTDTPLIKKFNDDYNDELYKLYSKLCFNVHKPKVDFRYGYSYDKEKFEEVYNLLMEVLDNLLTLFALRYPENYSLVKERIKVDLLESSLDKK